MCYRTVRVWIVLCLLLILSACTARKKGEYVWKIIDVDVSGDSAISGINHDNCFLSITKFNSYVFFLNGYYSEGEVRNAGAPFYVMISKRGGNSAMFTLDENGLNEGMIHFTRLDSAFFQKTRNSDEVSHSTDFPPGFLEKGFKMDVEKEERGKKADPYLASYNQWRVKATHKETDKEIHERVRGHVEFMQLYFENALETGARSVSECNLASPFEIFNNGVSMRKFEDINDWKDLFFDEADAKKGYQVVKDAMETRFKLAKTNSAFELNADIFRKLLKVID